MMPQRLRALLVAGVAACTLAACGGSDDRAFRPLQPGDAAPAWGARTLGGDSVTIGSLRGRTVLLNVWATWCPPCRAEMPALQSLAERYGDRGLDVVAVSIDHDAAAAAAFVDELDLSMRVLHDPHGRVTRAFRTTGVPESFLIDADGRIIRRWIGAFDPLAPDVIDLVESTLAAPERRRHRGPLRHGDPA